MSQPNETGNPFDPAGLFRTMRDASMDSWSKMMIQLVHTDAYAQATGAMLDAWLTASAPFQRAIEDAMSRVLTNLNMPTRSDVTSLAERLTNVEVRLDDLEAKLDEVLRAASRPAPTPAAPGETSSPGGRADEEKGRRRGKGGASRHGANPNPESNSGEKK
jgi:hypothetical protein